MPQELRNTTTIRRLATLLAAPAALARSAGRAEAVLAYNIFETGGNVVVQTSGSLNLPPRITDLICDTARFNPSRAVICTGPSSQQPAYRISGPTRLNGTDIVSSATHNGATLATLGFTTTGLIGTWTLTGTGDTIRVVVIGTPATASVPVPRTHRSA